VRTSEPVRRAAIVLAAVTSLLAPTSLVAASEQTYLDALTVQLEIAGQHFAEAAAAIRECNEEFFQCFSEPEQFAQRIDLAALGLSRVRDNLSGIAVPESYTSIHAQLSRGFGQVVDGLSLYAAGLRESDPDRLGEAADLVEIGKGNIDTATTAIRTRSQADFDFSLIALIAVVVMTCSVGILIFTLVRQLRRDRTDGMKKSATCPVCGETLDQWWTFRVSQVREWRTDHLGMHARDPGAVAHSRKEAR